MLPNQLLPLLPFLGAAVASSLPSARFPIVKRNETATGDKCSFKLTLWQLCTTSGSVYNVETFAQFSDVRALQNETYGTLSGNGVTAPQSVYNIYNNGTKGGEVLGDNMVFMGWEYFDWQNSTKGWLEKMTFATQGAGNGSQLFSDEEWEGKCKRGAWDKDDEDNNKWYDGCSKFGEKNFMKSRTRISQCAFDC